MSSTTIESLIEDVQRAFDEPPEHVETGLDVDDAALLQLRKACRLLAGSDQLLDAGYYTLVIEASFVAIEGASQPRCTCSSSVGLPTSTF